MSDAITAGTLSESDALVLTTDPNQRADRVELNYGNCVKHAEVDLSPSEKRGRHLAALAAQADTDVFPTVKGPAPIRKMTSIYSLILAALSILFAGMVFGHLLLLPDATVWPMAAASLILAISSAGIAWAVVREAL